MEKPFALEPNSLNDLLSPDSRYCAGLAGPGLLSRDSYPNLQDTGLVYVSWVLLSWK